MSDALVDEELVRGDQWLSTRQAADYIGVSETTLWGLVDDGRVIAYRPARVYRFRRADLDEYLEAVRVRPGQMARMRNPRVEHPQKPRPPAPRSAGKKRASGRKRDDGA